MTPGGPDGGVAVVDAGPDQAAGELHVEITTPQLSPYATGGEVEIAVVVSGGVADDVLLLANGSPLTTLVPPYQFTWNTAQHPEGIYDLTARATAHGHSYDSAARQIIIDRTAPTVSARTPTPGDANVRLDAPIQIQFSEPLLAKTVTDGHVRLSAGGADVAKQLSLSADGKTLVINPVFSESTATAVSVTLTDAITDMAGNSLAQPSAPWAWTMPDWWTFPVLAGSSGKSITSGQIKLDSTGRPVVAFNDGNLGVARWTGSEWKSLGSLAIGTNSDVSLALDQSGNPIIAAHPGNNSVSQVYRWSDNANPWSAVGDPVQSDVKIAVDGSNRLWRTYVSSNALQVERWVDGTGWTPVGSGSGTGIASFWLDLQVDGAGTAVIAGISPSSPFLPVEYTVSDLSWGGRTLKSAFPAFYIQGAPVVAISGTGATLFAYSWIADSGTAQQSCGIHFLNSLGSELGSGISGSHGGCVGSFDLTFDQTNQPLVAFVDGDVTVRRWDGLSQWVPLPGAPNGSGRSSGIISLAIDPSGRPLVADYELVGGIANAFVHIRNR